MTSADSLQAVGTFISGMILDDMQALYRNALRFGPSPMARHLPSVNPIIKDNDKWHPSNDMNQVIGDAAIALSYAAAPVASLASLRAGVSSGRAALEAAKATSRANKARFAAKTAYALNKKQTANQAILKAEKLGAHASQQTARRTAQAAKAYKFGKIASAASIPNVVDDVDYTVTYIKEEPTMEEIVYGKNRKKKTDR